MKFRRLRQIEAREEDGWKTQTLVSKETEGLTPIEIHGRQNKGGKVGCRDALTYNKVNGRHGEEAKRGREYRKLEPVKDIVIMFKTHDAKRKYR